MSDGVTYLGLVVGFGFILVAGWRLGAGSRDVLAGLFPAHGVRDWPTGVQEGDTPRFAIGHLDGLRPVPAILRDGSPARLGEPFDLLLPELVDLGSRRLGAPRA
jgi:hypothetical protein